MTAKITTRAVTLGVAILVIAAVSIAAYARGGDAAMTIAADTLSTTMVDTSEEATPSDDAVSEAAATELTVQETEALVLMREEEKLAHDVYVTLGELWGLRIFDNIAAAETSHEEAVASLLDQHGIEDPAVGNDIGVFTNPEYSALYVQLVEQGSVSIVEALRVGAFIEDLDIVDLDQLLNVVDAPSIATVFESLAKGSRNHLRAFSSQLEARGETYSPTYLTQADYDAIVGSPTERGRG